MMPLVNIAAATAKTQGGGWLPLLGPIIVFGVMIFFMIRSQKKQAAKRQQMLDHIKKGDRVVAAGGIHGNIVEVKDKTFIVQIAENVKVEVSKGGVSGIFNEAGDAQATVGK
ncbi:preprotein translocase subunit YajC [Lentisphaerota bacterium ZTH]|nr:preprotein translocase subunit YajC [Lentisphaerota bacterium]WET05761.1 preprotein translocase subunit YajC [Lentisphaerota bacterium ZTH]